MRFQLVVYSVVMTAHSETRQIVAPIGAGEARIPALVTLPSKRTILLYDERPAPASGTGSDFNGLTMASDLPNPNRIRWMERSQTGEWTHPRDLSDALPAITSDACVGVDGEGLMHIACASTNGRVGYMDSSAGGDRLQTIVAWGTGPEDLNVADLTEDLYREIGADALFATSGSTESYDGAVLLPYVVRTGERTHIRVVAVRGGCIQWISDPLVGPEGINLDETTLTVWDGRLVANCRLQGFEGRGAGGRYLAWGDGRTWSGGRIWKCDDPGCNAKAMGDLFVHPHSLSERACGSLVRLTPPWEGDVHAQVLASFGEGTFGYSDAIMTPEQILVVFERERGLWQTHIFTEMSAVH